MINLPFKMNFKNNYHFEVIDTKTNKIKQVVDTHNIILDNFWKLLAEGDWSDYTNFIYICLGKGNSEPSYSDTTLQVPLWENINLSGICDNGVFKWPDSRKLERKYPTSVLSLVYTIPATKELVGQISEIGFYGPRYRHTESSAGPLLLTRALLKDAEGNPITIDKTDIDKIILTITVELTFESTCSNFTFEDPPYNIILENIQIQKPSLFEGFCMPYRGRHSIPSRITLFTQPKPSWGGYSRENSENYPSSDFGGISQTEELLATFNWREKKITTDVSRILTNIGNTHYYNGIGILGIGYWHFPDYNIFPPQTLSNMKVGTGDGETTEFKCPLNLFIKDSDKIYKNGVLLTRNIDYTIEYDNNQDLLVEISLGNFAEITGGENDTRETASLFKSNIRIRTSHYSYCRSHIGSFYKEKPLFFTCKQPEKCNTLRLVNKMGAGTYILSYSDDGITYTECLRAIKNSQGENATYHFETITAKYWKLECSCLKNQTDTIYFHEGDLGNQQPFLGYVGKGIIFKEPPALNDVITMEAQIDRPFKNENFIIDMSVSITF